MVYWDAGALGADDRSKPFAGVAATLRRRFYGLVPLLLMGAVLVYVVLANG